MTIKKISQILLILTIMSLSIFKFSHPQLIPTGKIIIKEIKSQQSIPTWREQQLREFQITNKPLSYHATALKIEAIKTLITQIWFESNQSSLSTNDYLKNVLKNRSFKELDLSAQSNHDDNNLTEHYQTILSILYDLEIRKINKKQFNELDKKSVHQLALISKRINSKLLEIALKSAEDNNHQEILAEDILVSYNKLKQAIAPSKINYTYTKTDFRYTLWLRFFNSKLTQKHQLKRSSLPDLIRNQSNMLSTIFDHIITPNELELIVRFFIKNYTQITYPFNYENYHVFQNKPISKTFQK